MLLQAGSNAGHFVVHKNVLMKIYSTLLEKYLTFVSRFFDVIAAFHDIHRTFAGAGRWVSQDLFDEKDVFRL